MTDDDHNVWRSWNKLDNFIPKALFVFVFRGSVLVLPSGTPNKILIWDVSSNSKMVYSLYNSKSDFWRKILKMRTFIGGSSGQCFYCCSHRCVLCPSSSAATNASWIFRYSLPLHFSAFCPIITQHDKKVVGWVVVIFRRRTLVRVVPYQEATTLSTTLRLRRFSPNAIFFASQLYLISLQLSNVT